MSEKPRGRNWTRSPVNGDRDHTAVVRETKRWSDAEARGLTAYMLQVADKKARLLAQTALVASTESTSLLLTTWQES